jgi:3-methylcrotonyl-CoA carboxylase alpha subunit
MRRVLIANRGEIACRIIRSLRSLGLEAAAVHSEADAGALHVEAADAAFCLGPGPAAQSYLRADRILAAAAAMGADAVHPGYGFLAENAAFARAVAESGRIWVGPSPESIEAMGDKHRARALAEAAGVPVLPGSARIAPGTDFDAPALAAEVGLPLLVKASAGGGGIGMRLVEEAGALAEMVATTQAMAAKAFGDGTVYLERYIPRARHIEVQVFGFGDGEATHLFERDCSIQRRFQKVVEEAPAPLLPPSVRARMAEAAVALCRVGGYAGAGTIEFIVDAERGDFFFLEMNTRIQVEHPVTEMVTGVDLVSAQLRFARGERPEMGALAEPRGAAVECRLYAEDPARNFMPSPGLLARLELPETAHVRVDTGYRAGDRLTFFYDPLIAKAIAWGEDRAAAIDRMAAFLDTVVIEGVRTNLGFLARLMRDPEYRAGRIDTRFVERRRADLSG